jgi:hypothetical protein
VSVSELFEYRRKVVVVVDLFGINIKYKFTVERAFSLVTTVKTKQRNRMGLELMNEII